MGLGPLRLVLQIPSEYFNIKHLFSILIVFCHKQDNNFFCKEFHDRLIDVLKMCGSIKKDKVDLYTILEQFSQHIHRDSSDTRFTRHVRNFDVEQRSASFFYQLHIKMSSMRTPHILAAKRHSAARDCCARGYSTIYSIYFVVVRDHCRGESRLDFCSRGSANGNYAIYDNGFSNRTTVSRVRL